MYTNNIMYIKGSESRSARDHYGGQGARPEAARVRVLHGRPQPDECVRH